MKHLAKQIPAILLVALFMIAINVYAAPWTGPTAPFPDNNALEPLNRGNAIQQKTGSQAGLNLTWLFVDTSIASHMYSVNMTAQNALGYCFGQNVGFGYDPDALGCITSVPGTTQLPGEPGIPADLPDGTSGQTLRHDGTDWLANSILRNNGETVTVRRGSNSQGGGTPSDSESGFLGVKKAFAQTTSNADIFQAIKEIVNGANNVTGSNGLHVTSNGTTWLNGGLLNEGNAYNTGDLRVDGDSILKRTVISSGSLLSGYDADFQWGGPSAGNFWVGTKAEFEGPLKISSGNPGEGKFLSSDAEGNTSWRGVPVASTDLDIKVITKDFDSSNEVIQCPSGYAAIGGGGQCEGAGFLKQSKPTGPSYNTGSVLVTHEADPTGWRAHCSVQGVTVWAVCAKLNTGITDTAEIENPTPTGPVWHGTNSVTSTGSNGQSCLTYAQTTILPALGWPNITDYTKIGTGGNPANNAPDFQGQCWYSNPVERMSANFSAPNRAPSFGISNFWAYY